MSRSSGSCQNVSCSLKAVVDVPPTKMHADAEAPSSVVQPATTATLVASGGLAGNKFFDVSFFRQQVQEAHNMLETEIPYAISAKLLPMLNHSAGSALREWSMYTNYTLDVHKACGCGVHSTTAAIRTGQSGLPNNAAPMLTSSCAGGFDPEI